MIKEMYYWMIYPRSTILRNQPINYKTKIIDGCKRTTIIKSAQWPRNAYTELK